LVADGAALVMSVRATAGRRKRLLHEESAKIRASNDSAREAVRKKIARREQLHRQGRARYLAT